MGGRTEFRHAGENTLSKYSLPKSNNIVLARHFTQKKTFGTFLLFITTLKIFLLNINETVTAVVQKM